MWKLFQFMVQREILTSFSPESTNPLAKHTFLEQALLYPLAPAASESLADLVTSGEDGRDVIRLVWQEFSQTFDLTIWVGFRDSISAD